MGYAVYEDLSHRRWAGYGVLAICDYPECPEKIDRGLGYMCETHPIDDDSDDDEGCGLFFCAEHRTATEDHDRCTAKPDTPEWIQHMLTHHSWAPWRESNPSKVEALTLAAAHQPR